MEQIYWSDAFLTGNEEIDKQHRILIYIATKIYRGLNSDLCNKDLEQFFEDLFNYSDYHFETEERIMKKYEYSLYLAHKKIHSTFLQNLSKMREKYERGDKGVGNEMYDFLSKWIINHIAVEDKKLRSLF